MGKLIYRYGAMNSGKSAALLQLAHGLEQAGVTFMVATAEKHTSEISSRLGISRQCKHIDGILQFPTEGLKYLLIDESQWLHPKTVHKLRMIADTQDDIKIICYGLRTDTDGAFFSGSRALFTLADTLEHMESFCEHCGKPAILHNHRKGVHFGKESYESVCFQHWENK